MPVLLERPVLGSRDERIKPIPYPHAFGDLIVLEWFPVREFLYYDSEVTKAFS